MKLILIDWWVWGWFLRHFRYMSGSKSSPFCFWVFLLICWCILEGLGRAQVFQWFLDDCSMFCQWFLNDFFLWIYQWSFNDFSMNFRWFFLKIFVIFEWFSMIFGAFGSLGGIWASSGAVRGPLGRQADPSKDSGSEKLVRWTPPGLPKWGNFGINFGWFFE